jgi:hypothetical protein
MCHIYDDRTRPAIRSSVRGLRWRDGTTHLLFEPLELIGRLVALIPPPRKHQVSRGAGSGASWPDGLVPAAAGAEPEPASAQPAPTLRPRRLSWSDLRKRVFGSDFEQCPRCGAPLRILAVILNPTVACAILVARNLPSRAPPCGPLVSRLNAPSIPDTPGLRPRPGRRTRVRSVAPATPSSATPDRFLRLCGASCGHCPVVFPGQEAPALSSPASVPPLRIPWPQKRACFSFHRVGAQDEPVLPPQILRSGRLLRFGLDVLEMRDCARSSLGACKGGLRAGRVENEIRGQSLRIAIRWRVCSPRKRGNHPSIWASIGHRFVRFSGEA